VPLRERVPRRGFSRHNKANSLLSDMFIFSKIQYSRRRRSSTVELRREGVVWGDENFIQKFAPHFFLFGEHSPIFVISETRASESTFEMSDASCSAYVTKYCKISKRNLL
jgi:hypothetical protein